MGLAVTNSGLEVDVRFAPLILRVGRGAIGGAAPSLSWATPPGQGVSVSYTLCIRLGGAEYARNDRHFIPEVLARTRTKRNKNMLHSDMNTKETLKISQTKQKRMERIEEDYTCACRTHH